MRTKLSRVLEKLHTKLKTSADQRYDIAIVAYPGETEVTDYYDYAAEDFTVQDALDEWAEDHEDTALELYNTSTNGDIVIMEIPEEGIQKTTLSELEKFMEDLKADAEAHREEDFDWYDQKIEVYELYEANKDDLVTAIDMINNTDYAKETGFHIYGLYDSDSGRTIIIPEQ
jgi:hypothetical protein